VRTDRGLDRLITFLDAVVAIAITLLVLPLVDVLPDEGTEVGLPALVADEAGRFGAFALSFVVIASLWLAHHRLVERVGAYDVPFLLLNLVWTLTVVLLPFATQVAAVYGQDRLAGATYVGTMTLSSMCLSGLSLLLWRRPELRRPGSADELSSPAAALVTTGAFVLALGVVFPDVGYSALLLLLLQLPARRWTARRAGPGQRLR